MPMSAAMPCTMSGRAICASDSANCWYCCSRCASTPFSWIFCITPSLPSKSIMSRHASAWSVICGLKKPIWKNCSASSFWLTRVYTFFFCALTLISNTGSRIPMSAPKAMPCACGCSPRLL